jgi:predicted PurR-regulated permease PerM
MTDPIDRVPQVSVELPPKVWPLRHLLLGLLVGAAAFACLIVLKPFLAAIAWAAILSYASWPLYRWVRKPFGRFNTVAAFVMTLLLTCVAILPILWLLVLVGDEMISAYRGLATFLAQGPHGVPEFIRRIPWLGDQLQQQVDRFTAEPAAFGREVNRWAQAWAGELAAFVGSLGRNLGKFLITTLTVFFFYRDGYAIVEQSYQITRRFFGERLHPYITTIATMTRAVVYGLVVTAFAQGLIAGIGYAILGVEAAVLLGALTGILSMIPVLGTAAVWGSVAVYLIATGHLWKGIMLLIWGTVLVHPTDNLLRPLLISNATHVPFLLVMFGVIGGLAAFGLVGAFLGPILLAVGLAMWREWAADAAKCRS